MYEMKNGVYEFVFIHAISYLLFWIFIGIFLIVVQSQCTTLLLRSAQKSTQYKPQNIRDELFWPDDEADILIYAGFPLARGDAASVDGAVPTDSRTADKVDSVGGADVHQRLWEIMQGFWCKCLNYNNLAF